jgi:hypothetical protein
VRIVSDRGNAVLMVDTERFVAIDGNVSGETLKAGDIEVEFRCNNGGALTLVSLDGLPLETSGRLLLTMLGKFRNPGARYLDLGASRLVADPGSGRPLVGKTSVTLRLPGAQRRFQVSALMPDGEMLPRGGAQPAHRVNAGGEETPWYYLESGAGLTVQ